MGLNSPILRNAADCLLNFKLIGANKMLPIHKGAYANQVKKKRGICSKVIPKEWIKLWLSGKKLARPLFPGAKNIMDENRTQKTNSLNQTEFQRSSFFKLNQMAKWANKKSNICTSLKPMERNRNRIQIQKWMKRLRIKSLFK